jgi:hypothetical protein
MQRATCCPHVLSESMHSHGLKLTIHSSTLDNFNTSLFIHKWEEIISLMKI